jgi:hypothetical protein
MKAGSFETASASASFWFPIAFIITSRFPTKAEMSGARSASAPESFEASTSKRSRACSSKRSSAKSPREVERNGFR